METKKTTIAQIHHLIKTGKYVYAEYELPLSGNETVVTVTSQDGAILMLEPIYIVEKVIDSTSVIVKNGELLKEVLQRNGFRD